MTFEDKLIMLVGELRGSVEALEKDGRRHEAILEETRKSVVEIGTRLSRWGGMATVLASIASIVVTNISLKLGLHA